uniref:Putative secreted peptide n=1 Tax=Anopheles braziliensis TaxID=58242 RepID=A0A2M3ZRX5_9DIPT
MYPLMVYYFVRGYSFLCYIATFTPSDAFILNSGQQSTGHGIVPALGDGNAFFCCCCCCCDPPNTTSLIWRREGR